MTTLLEDAKANLDAAKERAAKRPPAATPIEEPSSARNPKAKDPFGIPEPRDNYGRYWWKVIQAIGSPDQNISDRAHFAIAEHCRRNLHRFRKQAIPERPGTVPEDDDEILHAIIDQKKAQTHTQRQRMIAMFSSWRYAVWKVEVANQAKIETLMNAVHTFRRLEIEEMALEVESFLEDEYDLRESVPENLGTARTLAGRLSADYEKLSWELRCLERRPIRYDGPLDDDDDEWREKGLPSLPGAEEEVPF